MLEGNNEFKLVCPFHEDVNASLKINLNNGTFYCFGCGESGNALKFVQLMNKNLNDLEACKKYYKILKSKKVKHIKLNNKVKKVKDDKQALVEAEDYYNGLKQTKWELPSAQKSYMVKRGFNVESLNKCKAKINFNEAYPIIFPMYDMGEFRGYVCRTMDPEIQKKRKYLYNKGFSRRNTLVGKYDNKVIVLVEGYMDWLKMKQFGVKYVAAILGWKITPQQIDKLKSQGVEYVISALDTDECGIRGTKYLKKYFKVIRFQFPKGVKDPGDLNMQSFKIANNKTKRIYKGAKINAKKI